MAYTTSQANSTSPDKEDQCHETILQHLILLKGFEMLRDITY